MVNCRQILQALVNFSQSPLELNKELSRFEWDYEDDPVIIEPLHIVSVINRFLSGDLNAKQVEYWANMIECREDLDYEASNREQLEHKIYELANPDIEGQLTIERCQAFFLVFLLPNTINHDYTQKIGLALENILNKYRIGGVVLNQS